MHLSAAFGVTGWGGGWGCMAGSLAEIVALDLGTPPFLPYVPKPLLFVLERSPTTVNGSFYSLTDLFPTNPTGGDLLAALAADRRRTTDSSQVEGGGERAARRRHRKNHLSDFPPFPSMGLGFIEIL